MNQILLTQPCARPHEIHEQCTQWPCEGMSRTKAGPKPFQRYSCPFDYVKFILLNLGNSHRDSERSSWTEVALGGKYPQWQSTINWPVKKYNGQMERTISNVIFELCHWAEDMQILVSWQCLPVNFHLLLEYLQNRMKKNWKEKVAMKRNITTQADAAPDWSISVWEGIRHWEEQLSTSLPSKTMEHLALHPTQ